MDGSGDEITRHLAMISVFSNPNQDVLHRTHGVVHLCNYLADDALLVVDYSSIQSVVAAIPLDTFSRITGLSPGWNSLLASFNGPFFILEKIGIDLDTLTGGQESDGTS